MPKPPRFDLTELQRRFRPYKCRKVADIPPFELWETGWKVGFTLTPENGLYSEREFQHVYLRILAHKPPNWPMPN